MHIRHVRFDATKRIINNAFPESPETRSGTGIKKRRLIDQAAFRYPEPVLNSPKPHKHNKSKINYNILYINI